MKTPREGMGWAGILLWMLVPLLVSGAVYVIACVPLVLPPLPPGFSWGPDPDVPRITLFEYCRLRLQPPAPLIGAT